MTQTVILCSPMAICLEFDGHRSRDKQPFVYYTDGHPSADEWPSVQGGNATLGFIFPIFRSQMTRNVGNKQAKNKSFSEYLCTNWGVIRINMHQTTSLYRQMNYQNVRANKLTTKKSIGNRKKIPFIYPPGCLCRFCHSERSEESDNVRFINVLFMFTDSSLRSE